MERTLISNLRDHVGETVAIAGWVDVRRDHGKLVFLDVRDRGGVVQVVATPKNEAAHAVASEVRGQWVVELGGHVKRRPEKMVSIGQPNGDIEFEARDITVLSQAAELPFEVDGVLNLDTHLDHLPLTLRSEKGRGMLRVQASLIEVFRRSLLELDFAEFQAPALVGGDAEGGAAAFKVEYYKDKPAMLATSPQLYKQIMVGVLERVFTTPKVFRGEAHATSRHLSEYSSLDFEMGFIKDHTDVMAVLEETIRRMVRHVSEKHKDVFVAYEEELPLMPTRFPVFKLRDAQAIIEKEYGGKVVGEPDLEPEHERQICEWAKQEHASDFVFITHYPVSKRPFYTYEDEHDPGCTKSFDLLFRGLEITTGGQRVHEYQTMLRNIEKWGLKPEDFSFYLQAFKYGMPPHGGSATGLERVTARLLNIGNVKQTTLFPRDMNRIDVRLSE